MLFYCTISYFRSFKYLFHWFWGLDLWYRDPIFRFSGLFSFLRIISTKWRNGAAHTSNAPQTTNELKRWANDQRASTTSTASADTITKTRLPTAQHLHRRRIVDRAVRRCLPWKEKKNGGGGVAVGRWLYCVVVGIGFGRRRRRHRRRLRRHVVVRRRIIGCVIDFGEAYRPEVLIRIISAPINWLIAPL